jgi:hypothetical protein
MNGYNSACATKRFRCRSRRSEWSWARSRSRRVSAAGARSCSRTIRTATAESSRSDPPEADTEAPVISSPSRLSRRRAGSPLSRLPLREQAAGGVESAPWSQPTNAEAMPNITPSQPNESSQLGPGNQADPARQARAWGSGTHPTGTAVPHEPGAARGQRDPQCVHPSGPGAKHLPADHAGSQDRPATHQPRDAGPAGRRTALAGRALWVRVVGAQRPRRRAGDPAPPTRQA